MAQIIIKVNNEFLTYIYIYICSKWDRDCENC